MDKSRFQDWGKAKELHNKFVNEVLQSKAHVICTNRVKQDYSVETNDKGKSVVTKLGTADKQQDGLNYEFTVVLDINTNHLAHADKDRTNLFDGKEDFKVTEETGKLIKSWCEGSSQSKELEIDIQDALTKVNETNDLQNLVVIWNEMSPEMKNNEKIKEQFTKKKLELK